MPAPSIIFEPGKTHCPGCHAPLIALVDTCPHCGFTAAACLARFPYEPPPLTRYIDPEALLTPAMRKKSDRAINRLESAFPQIVFHVCLLQLAEGVDPREFGFWLFNRSAPRGALEEQNRPHAMLLVIDRRSQTAALTVGYGLDPFLDDYLLAKTIEEGAAHMADGDYGIGIARLADDLRNSLKQTHTRARFAFVKWQRHGHSRREPAAPLPAPELPVAAIPPSRQSNSESAASPQSQAHAHAP